MRQFRNHLIGIQQGQEMLFEDFNDGGPMWTGTGPRQVQRRVSFDPPFQSVPAVVLGLSLLDVSGATNPRLDLTHDEVGADGALIVLRTWGDTRIARLRVSWTAIGEVHDPDAWTGY